MQSVRRDKSRPWRHVLALWAAVLVHQSGTEPVRAQQIARPAITVEAGSGSIGVTLFATADGGTHPAVIILHGRQELSDAYARYAERLASRGMDAFLVAYYDDADRAAMASDRATRVAYFRTHLAIWSQRVRDVASHALKRTESSGKVGLLGFSNGGFLAVACAASDPRIAALVVFYGGIARAGEADITRLPPLLALHGDADHVIPLQQGAALVEKARALGGQADLVVYPGADHGFDFDATRTDAKDASDRALSFLETELAPAH